MFFLYRLQLFGHVKYGCRRRTCELNLMYIIHELHYNAMQNVLDGVYVLNMITKEKSINYEPVQ